MKMNKIFLESIFNISLMRNVGGKNLERVERLRLFLNILGLVILRMLGRVWP